jgi:transcription elongation GreA/GreB family factor
LHQLKHQLFALCHEYVDSRIATASQALDDAQAAANEESKSSVGDKYETGRAMLQIEGEKAAHQLAEATRLKDVLEKIPVDLQSDKVVMGSLVITNTKKIFVSIGIGKLNVDGDEILVVGPTSPLGKAVIGLSVNDMFSFNDEPMVILEIG